MSTLFFKQCLKLKIDKEIGMVKFKLKLFPCLFSFKYSYYLWGFYKQSNKLMIFSSQILQNVTLCPEYKSEIFHWWPNTDDKLVELTPS